MATHRLYRSSKDKLFFGVLGGMAEYFDLDPGLLRIIFVILLFVSGGAVLLAYVIAAIIMPPAPMSEVPPGQDTAPRETMTRNAHELPGEAAEAGGRFMDATGTSSGSGTPEEVRRRRQQMAGAILIGLGALILIANFGWFNWFSWGRFWPLVIIAAGLLLLLNRQTEPRQ